MSKLYKNIELGDMIASYRIDDDKNMGLVLVPASKGYPEDVKKDMKIDSLVQIKLAGDIYNEAYAMGNSLRNGETTRRLKFCEQKVAIEQKSGAVVQLDGSEATEVKDAGLTDARKVIVTTVMKDDRGNSVYHILNWKCGAPYVTISCRYDNNTGKEQMIEMFHSFSLSELTPYVEGDAYEALELRRIRSVWSMEGRLECIPVEDLQLEPAWSTHAVRSEVYGQVGSMPVNKFFPFIAICDTKTKVTWGAQIAHNASWEMEAYRKDDGLAISGGLADRDHGQWMKKIANGESFTTPEAIVSVSETDNIDIFTARLTQYGLDAFEGTAPESEHELPIVFNEYCTTWGNPSHENIMEILNAIKGKGFSYFVIDCGWYKEEGIPWDIDMGDYQVSKELFPDGLEKTVGAIKENGMVPGIWFEIENVGSAAKAYQNTEHLIHKDGAVLTSYFRRFWNMDDPWVENYLTEKVIGTLQKYGFGYMKIDYNETLGAGCDGYESVGEGLRVNMEKSAQFIEKVKREVPGIILENCSSGGHRLEPSLMARMSMASFSDAHECREIPIIAARLHRVIHPSQSQIWAVIRKDDSLKRIAYSVANTFLGRMCISGDVTELSAQQWQVIDKGIAFYKKIAPVIKHGQSFVYEALNKSMRHPEGWQVLARVSDNGLGYAVLNTFGGELPGEIRINLDELGVDSSCKISDIFGEGCAMDDDASCCNKATGKVYIEGKSLVFVPGDNDQATAVAFE